MTTGREDLKHAQRTARSLALVALIPLVLGTCSSQTNPNSKRTTSVDDTGTYNWLMVHGDRGRTGWNANETVLTPANVGGSSFGPLWSSPIFDSYGGTVPHM